MTHKKILVALAVATSILAIGSPKLYDMIETPDEQEISIDDTVEPELIEENIVTDTEPTIDQGVDTTTVTPLEISDTTPVDPVPTDLTYEVPLDTKPVATDLYSDYPPTEEELSYMACAISLLDSNNCLSFDADAACVIPEIDDKDILAACGPIPGNPGQQFLAAQNFMDPFSAARVILNVGNAIRTPCSQLSADIIPGASNDTEQDAARHLIGSSLLYFGVPVGARPYVLSALNIRERADQASGRMDVANNTSAVAIARRLITNQPQITAAEFRYATVVESILLIGGKQASVVTSVFDQWSAAMSYLEFPEQTQRMPITNRFPN